MGISKRLKFIADMVTKGYIAADIGTDHGYVPVYLVRNGISPKAYAVDISKGSLEKAIELCRKTGLTDKIECRLSDGFEKMQPYEAESIIIAGMGGILMSNIMQARLDVTESAKELILSPHRDADLVRSVVVRNGFTIIFDEEIEDKKKKYPIIKAVKNNAEQ